jgi:restriction system protein
MSLHSVIQCKARGNASIGVDKVRELLGVVTAKHVRRGILICNTAYTSDAKVFAQDNHGVVLADLEWMFKQLHKAPEATRTAWASRFFGLDCDVPSCPACEIKLVHRTSRRGDFYGCRNYPRGCRTKIGIRDDLLSRTALYQQDNPDLFTLIHFEAVQPAKLSLAEPTKWITSY